MSTYRTELREPPLWERQAAARVAVAGLDRLGMPVPDQFREFAAGNRDEPGPLPELPPLY
ncbi:hypothetical protein GCM10009648_41310 [Tsukamurella spumae]